MIDLLRDQSGPDTRIVYIMFVAHNPAGANDLSRRILQSLIDMHTAPHFGIEIIKKHSVLPLPPTPVVWFHQCIRLCTVVEHVGEVEFVGWYRRRV